MGSSTEREDAYNDDDKEFLQSLLARLIPTVVGSISAISSIFVMYFIRYSQSKLSSPYHLIIFFMSFWDVFMSTAIALTTIPMPSASASASDAQDVYEHPFEGSSYGTAATCQAQGFVILVSMIFILHSIVTLNMFYVCSIRYRMTDDTVKRRLLPIMLIIACVVVTATVLAYLIKYENPMQPHISPPICTHLSNHGKGDLLKKRVFLYSSILLLILVSMGLVVRSILSTDDPNAPKRDGTNEDIGVRNNETEELDYESNGYNASGAVEVNGNDDDNDYGRIISIREKSNKSTKRTILRQVLMYIGVFISVHIFPLLKYILVVGTGDAPVVVYVLATATMPSLGFFNALIFSYHKVYILRTAHPDFTFWKALKIVIISPSSVPEILLSRMEIVANNGDGDEDGDEDPQFSLPSDFASPETPSYHESFVLDHVIIDDDTEHENDDANLRKFSEKQLTVGGIKRRGRGIL